jgi:hypothetical protein
LVNSQAAGFATAAQEIKTNQKALLQMAQAGLQGTEAFNKLALATGQLKDDVEDLRNRTKALGSDTFVFDGLIQGAQTLAGVYGVAQGAAALFGDENEELQKTLIKLQAVQTVIQGLQSIANGLQKESSFILLLNTAREKALTAVQIIKNFVLKGTITATKENTLATQGAAVAEGELAVATTASATAMKVLRTALIATGIGALLVLLPAIAEGMGLFSSKTDSAKDSMEGLNRAVERNNEILNESIKNLDRQSALQIEKLKQRGATQKELDEAEIQALRDKEVKTYQSYQRQKAALDKFDKETAQIRSALTSAGIDPEDAIKSRAEISQKLRDQTEKDFQDADDLRTQADLKEQESITKSVEIKKKAEKKSSDDSRSLLEDNLKKDLAIRAENARRELEIARDLYKVEYEDQERSEIDRIASLKDFYIASSKLIALDTKNKEDAALLEEQIDLKKAEQIKNAKLRGETKAAIIKTYEDKILGIMAEDGQQQIALDTEIGKTTNDIIQQGFELEEKLLEDHVKTIKEIQDRKNTNVSTSLDENQNITSAEAINAALLDIQKSYGSKRENLQQRLQDKLTQIDNTAQIDRLDNQSKELEQELANALLIEAPTEDIEKRISENAKEQSELRLKIAQDEYDRKKRLKDKELDTINEFAQATFDLEQTFGDAGFTRAKNKLTQDQRIADEQEKIQIDAVNNSQRTEQEKADAIAIIQAKAESDKKAREAREAELDYRKAQFDKKIAILEVIGQIAIDIAKGQFDRAALAGIALIKLVATPIPRYKGGRGYGKEETAIVGDGGQHEYIHRANGLIEKTPAVETVTHLMPKDRVYKNKAEMMKELVMSSLPLSTFHVKEDGSIQEIRKMTNRMVDAVENIQINTTLITKGGWRSVNSRLAKNQAWVDKYIKG